MNDVKSVPEVQANRKIVVFEEPEVFEEPAKEIFVFEEPEVFEEPVKETTVAFIEPFAEPVVSKEPLITNEDSREVQDNKFNDAFEFVASAQSSKHLEAIDPSQLFGTPLTPAAQSRI